jgi:hypothetical protein
MDLSLVIFLWTSVGLCRDCDCSHDNVDSQCYEGRERCDHAPK